MLAYLGVDGGGTRTRSLLVDTSGHVLGSGLSGAANVHHCTSESLAQTLSDVIQQAFANVPSGTVRVETACFGLAGASSAQAKETIRASLAKLEPQPEFASFSLTDAEIALTGGLLDRPGIILIAGTGSVCFGRDAGGHIHRTGGWGSIADDAGSGGWMGRRAIEYAVRQADGRIAGDVLKNAVFSALGIDGVGALSHRLHSSQTSWRDIAALCPVVLHLSEKGDTIAELILRDAIEQLCQLVGTTMKKTGLPECTVVLTGGLAESGSLFTSRLKTALLEAFPGIRIESPRIPPVAGAVLEAHRQHLGYLAPAFISQLEQSCLAEPTGQAGSAR